MAKKSKKSKRQSHQLKKSKQGQTRKRRPKTPGTLSLKDSDNQRPDVISMLTVSRDVPVAQDGYRIVGPAQAMMDYAKPLIDESLSQEQFSKRMTFAQLCWNLAIVEHREPKEFEKQRRKIIRDFGGPDVEDKINMMVERFHQMFPDVGRTPSFYMKERVIDIEEYEPFDESTLHISEGRISPTKEEAKLAETLREIDPSEDEAELSEWQDEVVNCYAEWCIAKGVPDDRVGDFAYAVSSYLDFLSNYHDVVLSDYIPAGAVREFMRTFFIRKTWMEAQGKSAMPCALKLLMRYLDEKGIVGGTKRIGKIIESEEDTFQRNLRLYTDPSLGGKVVPFREKD